MKTGIVYEIKINDIRRYVGVTNNFIRRQKEHIRCIKLNKAKYLYQMINETPPEETKISFRQLTGEVSILEARRYEAYLILDDLFSEKSLWQYAPYSFKYF
jgi:hypothetical protein